MSYVELKRLYETIKHWQKWCLRADDNVVDFDFLSTKTAINVNG